MTQFRNLAIGDSFDFVSPDRTLNSFFLRCVKIGKRAYQDEKHTTHIVGTVACRVYNVVSKEDSMVAAHRCGRDYARQLDSSQYGAVAFMNNRPLWLDAQREAFTAGYVQELRRMTSGAAV